jgi:hypothetical protein
MVRNSRVNPIFFALRARGAMQIYRGAVQLSISRHRSGRQTGTCNDAGPRCSYSSTKRALRCEGHRCGTSHRRPRPTRAWVKWSVAGPEENPRMTQAVRRREAAVVSRARLLLLLLLLACGAPCRALQFDETSRDLRISLSGDFMHADGALIAAARYGAAWGARVGWAHADFDSAPHAFVGFDHVWTKGRWRAGLERRVVRSEQSRQRHAPAVRRLRGLRAHRAGVRRIPAPLARRAIGH